MAQPAPATPSGARSVGHATANRPPRNQREVEPQNAEVTLMTEKEIRKAKWLRLKLSEEKAPKRTERRLRLPREPRSPRETSINLDMAEDLAMFMNPCWYYRDMAEDL
ncbi:hypothetical protein ACOMHN_047573 [Nucella lapillus]